MKPLNSLAKFTSLTLTLMALALPVYAQEQGAATGAAADIEQAAQAGMTEKLDINHANAQQLSKLTYIGDAKAQEIVRYRNANGPFKSVDELANVKGIGKATIEKNRTRLLVAQ